MKKCNHLHTNGYKSCEKCREKWRLNQKRRYQNKNCRTKQKQSTKKWRQKSPWYSMWEGARKRSKDNNLEFNLTTEFVHNLYDSMPVYCPVLNILLTKDQDLNNLPSLDRIIPSKGYVQDNVRIISHRANLLKNNATLEEMSLILEDLIKISNLTGKIS